MAIHIKGRTQIEGGQEESSFGPKEQEVTGGWR
jgi:hypothetical protein